MEDYRLDNISDRTWTYEDIHYWVNPEDNTCNATIIYDDKKSRLRAGILIIKDDEVLLGEEADEPGVFSLPGGGLEQDETPVDAAIREAQEEVHINVKNAIDTKLDYCECHDELKDWVKEHVPEDEAWYNYYTCLIIAEYNGKYKGKVDEVDEDESMESSATWYKISDAINDVSFKEQWKEALKTFGYLTESLHEDTRTVQINKSRSAGEYKDKSRGKNRFERKRYSKVANAVKAYNKIDMNKFFKQDILEVTIPITGETNSYDVTIKLEGVVAEMARNIKNNKNKFEYRTVVQALTKVFNTSDVYTKCTCEDFKYRFAHWNIVHNVSVDDTAHDPGPGKGIANPNDDKGCGCKHILLVLANGDWMMKVASVINNYVHYAEEHLQKPFLNVIFPKLYGVVADEMVEQDIIDDESFLDSAKGLIDAINEYGKNRGKIKPKTNKNPVAQKEKDKQQKDKQQNKDTEDNIDKDSDKNANGKN